MIKFDGPGRGRKQCKACGGHVGVRTAVCECGSAFPKKVTSHVRESTKPPARDQAMMIEEPAAQWFPRRRMMNIYAAPGECPVPYDGDVHKWAQEVRILGEAKGEYYTVSALGLWLRRYIPEQAEWRKTIDRLAEMTATEAQ